MMCRDYLDQAVQKGKNIGKRCCPLRWLSSRAFSPLESAVSVRQLLVYLDQAPGTLQSLLDGFGLCASFSEAFAGTWDCLISMIPE